MFLFLVLFVLSVLLSFSLLERNFLSCRASSSLSVNSLCIHLPFPSSTKEILLVTMLKQSKKSSTINANDAREKKLDKARIENFRITQDREEWKEMYEASNLKNRSIHAIDVMQSASKCTDSQYIALQSIAPDPKPPSYLLKNLHKYGLVEAKQEADQLLQNSPEFQKEIQLVDANNSIQSLSGDKDAR